jgi:hypothetical protein
VYGAVSLSISETILLDRPLPTLSSDRHDVYEPIKLELMPFDPLGKHNIPGFIMFCNVSKPFDFALIRPFRSAAFDLNQNDLEQITALERCLRLR